MDRLAIRIVTKASVQSQRKEDNTTDFTRHKKLDFADIITITPGIVVKSLLLAIDDYIDMLVSTFTSFSKQAFSLARTKILPCAYKELLSMSVNEILCCDAVRHERGHRFLAIDGTDLMLPKAKAICEKFKPVSGSYLPHARASLFYDAVSGFVLDACFDSVDVSELVNAQ